MDPHDFDEPAPALQRAVQLWMDHLRIEKGASRHTMSAYWRDIGRYVAWLTTAGVQAPADIRPSMVSDFLAHLRTGDDQHPPLAASSAARTLVAVRGWHRFLAIEGESESDPATDVSPPTSARPLPKALSVAEVERLLQAASIGEGAAVLRDRALLEVLYGCGARVTEAINLDVDDVDLPDGERGGMVRLFGKGRKERLVPLGGFGREALEAWLVRGRPALAARGKSEGAVFVNARGGRLSRQSAWRILQACGQRANMDGAVGPHTLRHSFATHLLDGGADVRVVQELLGHASVTTTQIYTMVTVQHLREVYAQAHPRAR